MDTITIIGKGRVGTTLADAIQRNENLKLANHLAGHSPHFPVITSDVIIIAVKDEAVHSISKRALAATLKPPRVMLHLAGSLPASALASSSAAGRARMMRLALHPMQTFSEPDTNLLKDIYWMVSTETNKGVYWARRFVRELGGKNVIPLPPEALPLYHAMAVFSSNFITLLYQAIEEMSEAIKTNPDRMKVALRALSERAVANAVGNPAKSVLTGPFQRKDMETIEKHEKALNAVDPKLRAIYDAFLSYALPGGTTKR